MSEQCGRFRLPVSITKRSAASKAVTQGLDGDDLGTWLRPPATHGRARDASLEGAIDVLCGADQLLKTVVVTVLRASCGGHASIMATTEHGSTGRMVISAPIA